MSLPAHKNKGIVESIEVDFRDYLEKVLDK